MQQSNSILSAQYQVDPETYYKIVTQKQLRIHSF